MREARSDSARNDEVGRAWIPGSPGAVIGGTVARWRDAVARLLIRIGATPNVLTVAGCLLTAGAGVCLVLGAGHAAPWSTGRSPTITSWWPQVAALLLVLAFAMDLLDGAVARIGALSSRFGAVLDSSLDRFSDLFIFLGCAMHFAFHANITYVVWSAAAAANAVLVSYVKARAERFVDDCGVGYWQRGERCGVFLVGCCLGHVPAALWLLGTLPLLTVFRRLRHAHAMLTDVQPWEPGGLLRRIMPWRHPRGSPGYDLCTGLCLAFVIFGPHLWPGFWGQADPLGTVLRQVVVI
jgi:phosphatidylglycerophosphate synthase